MTNPLHYRSRNHRGRRVPSILVALVTTAGVLQLGPWSGSSATAADFRINKSPAFLVVYDNNVENLQSRDEYYCQGDWPELENYMKTAQGANSYAPDVVIAQQVGTNVDDSGTRETDKLISQLQATFPGTAYKAIIADEPAPRKVPSKCAPNGAAAGDPLDEKYDQTNAIIYRTARLTIAKNSAGAELVDPFWSLASPSTGSGTCQNANVYTTNYNRVHNIKARFHDAAAGRDVTIASAHWPTSQSGGGSYCADENMNKLDGQMDVGDYGGALRIIGMDSNSSDYDPQGVERPWHVTATGSMVYKDAINEYCSDSTDASHFHDCLDANWTNHYDGDEGGSPRDVRIDFLLGQTFASGVAYKPDMLKRHTITFADACGATTSTCPFQGESCSSQRADNTEAGWCYSEHRAVTAAICYRNVGDCAARWDSDT
jgi:hypothetical protein